VVGRSDLTSSIETLRITDDGTVQLPSGSPGIKFGTRNANLNDYEEGTWTPTVIGFTTAGTVNYSIRQGRYQKVGRWVHVNVFVSWSGGSGGVGGLAISGLPFTSENVTNMLSFSGAFQSDIGTMPANSVVYGSIVPNATNIGIDHYPAGGGTAAVTDWAASGAFGVTISYRTT
jgi:hypothetical protein